MGGFFRFFFTFLLIAYGSTAYAAAIVLPASSKQISSTIRLVASWNMPGATVPDQKGWNVNAWGTPPATSIAKIVAGKSQVFGNNLKAQQFMVLNEGGGAAHLVYDYTFQYGKTYTATVYLRSDVPAVVSVALRHDAMPYDIFAQDTVTLGTAWTAVTIKGSYQHNDAGAGSIRIIPLTLDTNIYVGQMTLDAINGNELLVAHPGHAISNVFFGMLVNKLGVHANWPGLNTEIIRMWDTGTSWMDIEPGKNIWDFSRADYYVRYASSHAAPVLFTLGQTPVWAASNPHSNCTYATGCSPPANASDWRLYVRALVARYGKIINYWELWNEPDYSGFWNGTPEQLVSLAQIARQEIKSNNPNAIIVGPSVTSVGGIAFLDRFLAAGGGAYIDAVSFHDYYTPNPAALIRTINSIKYVMNEHNLGNLPLWNTEGAPVCDSEIENCTTWVPSSNDKLDTSFKALFIMAAEGVTNFDYYNWEIATPISELSVPILHKNLTAAGQSYNSTTNLLAGAKILDSYTFKNINIVRFSVGTENEVAIWSDSVGAKVEIPVSWNFKTADYWEGQSITIPSNNVLQITSQPLVLH